MNERRAIDLCLKHRDPAGFEFLVRQYRREAFYHAYALLGNEEDAADACQESFLRAFAAMPQLRKLTRFYPWFYRILRNYCLNALDRRKTAIDYRQRRKESWRREDALDSTDPSNLLEKREEARAVGRVLMGMKPEHREILALKYLRDRSYAEISALLTIPRGTVMSRLYLARKAFREAFETALPPSDPRNCSEKPE